MKWIYFVIIMCLFSCKRERNNIEDVFKQWNQRKIIFPKYFNYLDKNDGVKSLYKILNYVDSAGCTSCKLQLHDWKLLMNDIKEAIHNEKYIDCILVLASVDSASLRHIILPSILDYPICIDEQDSLNKLNHFPSDPRFQTFLLDKNNRVVAIGNPVHNPKIKELYMKIIKGDKDLKPSSTILQTKVSVTKSLLDLGTFSWNDSQKGTFRLKNIGNKPLVISDAISSCGCTKVKYEKQPIRPNQETELTVTYKADHKEHFNKTIAVYCNAEESPIQLRITGNAR